MKAQGSAFEKPIYVTGLQMICADNHCKECVVQLKRRQTESILDKNMELIPGHRPFQGT